MIQLSKQQGDHVLSNLTPEEQFRLYGRFTDDTAKALLDANDKSEAFDGIDAHICEAKAQFPNEDCMAEFVSELREVAKRVRGENRSDLMEIIEAMEAWQQRTHNNTEYGLEELNKALKLCN